MHTYKFLGIVPNIQWDQLSTIIISDERQTQEKPMACVKRTYEGCGNNQEEFPRS